MKTILVKEKIKIIQKLVSVYNLHYSINGKFNGCGLVSEEEHKQLKAIINAITTKYNNAIKNKDDFITEIKKPINQAIFYLERYNERHKNSALKFSKWFCDL